MAPDNTSTKSREYSEPQIFNRVVEKNMYIRTEDGQVLSIFVAGVLEAISGYKCENITFRVVLQGGHIINFTVGSIK